MNARTPVREDAAAVRHAMTRAARGQGSAVVLSGVDAGEVLTYAALEASSTGWHVVEPLLGGDTREAVAEVVRELGPDSAGLLAGCARPLADLLAGEDPCPQDVAFALLVALDRLATEKPVLLAVHGMQEACPAAVEVLASLADLVPRTRCVLVHARPGEGAAPGGSSGEAADEDPDRVPAALADSEPQAADDVRLTRAVERARERASSRDFGLASARRGIVRSRAGVAALALPDLLAGLAHGAGVEPLRGALLHAALVDSWLATGELHRAAEHRSDLVALSRTDDPAAGIAQHALAELAAAAGDHGKALTGYRAAGGLVHPDQPLPLQWRRGAAIAALHLGRPAEARRLALGDLEAARVVGPPDALAQALRTLAAIDLSPRSSALLEEARAVLDQAWAPRLAAQVDTDLAGQLVLTGGDSVRAVGLLRGAETFAREQRLLPLLQRIQRVLTHLGEQPLAVPQGRAEQLDVVGRQVATLVAAGLSDEEVAGQLMTTVGEVRTELRHALRVLGLRSRARLAAVLAD